MGPLFYIDMVFEAFIENVCPWFVSFLGCNSVALCVFVKELDEMCWFPQMLNSFLISLLVAQKAI